MGNPSERTNTSTILDHIAWVFVLFNVRPSKRRISGVFSPCIEWLSLCGQGGTKRSCGAGLRREAPLLEVGALLSQCVLMPSPLSDLCCGRSFTGVMGSESNHISLYPYIGENRDKVG